jgi:hypothetical protein
MRLVAVEGAGVLKMALSPADHPALKGALDDVPHDELVHVALAPSIRQYLSAPLA